MQIRKGYVVLCFFESLQWTWIPLDFVVTVDFSCKNHHNLFKFVLS